MHRPGTHDLILVMLTSDQNLQIVMLKNYIWHLREAALSKGIRPLLIFLFAPTNWNILSIPHSNMAFITNGTHNPFQDGNKLPSFHSSKYWVTLKTTQRPHDWVREARPVMPWHWQGWIWNKTNRQTAKALKTRSGNRKNVRQRQARSMVQWNPSRSLKGDLLL